MAVVQHKLVEVWKLIEKGCKARCVQVKCKKKRRILTKLHERWYSRLGD